VRRGVGYVALSFGLIVLFLAPLSRFYVLPRVKKIPTDYYFRAVSGGTGVYLDPTAGFREVGPVKLRNVHVVRGSPADSSATVAVWDSFDETLDVENHHQLSYSIDRYTFHRTSAESVACCGQNERRSGSLTLLMPIGVERKSYLFWDVTAKRAFPMEYEATTEESGMTVYHFHQQVSPMQINHLELPGDVVGRPKRASVRLSWWYRADTDIWAEPITGGIVKARQRADQWLEDSRGVRKLTIATTDVVQTPTTVRALANQARSRLTRLRMLEFWLPVVGPAAGLVLIGLGFLLLGGMARPGASEVPAPVRVIESVRQRLERFAADR
jgi:DUF3068 family protein